MATSSPPTDLSLPLPSGSPESPWSALVSTLKAKGILRSNSDSHLDSPPSEVRTVADLLGSDCSSKYAAAAGDGDGDGDGDGESGGKKKDATIPLVLVLVSGSWCAPCRNFTPVLAECNDALVREGIKVRSCVLPFLYCRPTSSTAYQKPTVSF